MAVARVDGPFACDHTMYHTTVCVQYMADVT